MGFLYRYFGFVGLGVEITFFDGHLGRLLIELNWVCLRGVRCLLLHSPLCESRLRLNLWSCWIGLEFFKFSFCEHSGVPLDAA